MDNVLVKTDEYSGQYVALKGFNDYTVVGSGNDPATALKKANEQGIKNPVLVYIPKNDMAHIYLTIPS